MWDHKSRVVGQMLPEQPGLNIEDNSYKNNTHNLYKRNTIPEGDD